MIGIQLHILAKYKDRKAHPYYPHPSPHFLSSNFPIATWNELEIICYHDSLKLIYFLPIYISQTQFLILKSPSESSNFLSSSLQRQEHTESKRKVPMLGALEILFHGIHDYIQFCRGAPGTFPIPISGE